MPRPRHGYAKRGQTHPLYFVWRAMKQRCLNPKHKGFQDYGGRGITVCPEWLHDPKAFVDWGLSHGWKSRLQIDRSNNDGNYEPGNCRFVTSAENNRNRRPSKPYKKSSNLPTGVHSNRKRFEAQIGLDGKKIYLGTFDTPEEASEMFQFAKRQLRLYREIGITSEQGCV